MNQSISEINEKLRVAITSKRAAFIIGKNLQEAKRVGMAERPKAKGVDWYQSEIELLKKCNKELSEVENSYLEQIKGLKGDVKMAEKHFDLLQKSYKEIESELGFANSSIEKLKDKLEDSEYKWQRTHDKLKIKYLETKVELQDRQLSDC